MHHNLLRVLPNSVLCSLKKVMPDKAEIIDIIRLDAFLEKTDFDKLNVLNWPICEIKEGEWDYLLFNVCFLEDMLRKITYCLSNGYRPVVNFVHPTDNDNTWEQLFEQPYNGMIERKTEGKICDVKVAPLYFPTFPTAEDVKKYGKLYRAFAKPNKYFQNYFQQEYDKLIKGKRVIGVLCRGTDYVATKPKSHPVQPAVEDIIALVKQKMVELRCESIYLATEEAAIHRQFEEAFPGKILINKRHYFDEYYQMQGTNDSTLISAVHFKRENDNYYKALEYFSSLYLLAHCNALIAGNCGGSRAALYLNYGAYEYSFLFNLGVY